MGRKLKWTEEKLKEEALKYDTRIEFQKGSYGAYSAAQRRGLLEEVCFHMEARFTWTKDMLKTEALKYDTRFEFSKGNSGAYTTAHKRGLLNDICSHMEARFTWTEDMLKTEASKYDTRGEFSKASKNAYQTAFRRGLLDQICGHMGGNVSWTEEMLQTEADRYDTRGEFQKGSKNAYEAAKTKNLLDDICGHMKAAQRGFDKSKPSILYYLKIKTDNKFIYKVGITNLSIKERYTKWELDLIFDYQKWCRPDGFDIYDREQAIRKKYKRYELTSKSDYPLSSGWTECFDRDVLELF